MRIYHGYEKNAKYKEIGGGFLQDNFWIFYPKNIYNLFVYIWVVGSQSNSSYKYEMGEWISKSRTSAASLKKNTK